MKPLPNHIAIIPDGNRRWAKSRIMLLWEGHRHGISNFRKIADYGFKKGVKYLTFWALSIDNLKKRSAEEIRHLLEYIKIELKDPNTLNDFLKNGVRVRVVGKWRELVDDTELKEVISSLETKTEKCDKFNLTILFAYDGKAEMLEAIAKVRQPVGQDSIKDALWTGFLPAVDLVIRTGGEPHWSGGFMMWLVADSQLYFTETKWPDFSEREFDKAVDDYVKREKRLGK